MHTISGGTIGNGCTFGVGLLAVFAGNALLMVLGALCGVIGFRSGRSTYALFEAMFGSKGSVVVSAIRGISAMSFIGVLLDSFSSTLVQLLPWFPKWLAVLLFAGCILSTSINGFKGLEFISKVAAPALWILLALCLVMSLRSGVGPLVEWVPSEPIPFITAMGAAVATWVAGAGMTADLTRYSKKVSHVWGGAAVGYLLGSGLFEAVAVVTAINAGSGNLVIVMSTMGLLIPAVIVLGLALWTTTDNNIYSASLAFTNASKIAGVNISKPVWTIVCVIIAVAVSFLGLASNFSAWLSFTGSLCGPLAGMMIAHFLVLNRGEKFYVPTTFRLSGWLAWLIAGIGSQFTSSAIPSVTAILFGFVLYIVFYLVLDKGMNLHKDKEMDPGKGKVWLIPHAKEVTAAVEAAEAAAKSNS